MRAMILAAGRGQRMRPLTDTTPKPLLTVGGRTLIERRIDALVRAGFKDLVINLGWLGDQIERHLGDGRRLGAAIRYSHEPPGALETAGGIRHALPLLGDAPFLVVNADVECDFALETLRGLAPDGLAHLVMIDNPDHHREGDFALVAGRLQHAGTPRLTYSGIGVFRPALFEPLAPGVRALRPVLDEAVSAGRVEGRRHSGRWTDIGTPERLKALDRACGSA